MAENNDHPVQKLERTSPLEWIVALSGAIIVIGTIGYMLYYGISHPATPPNVTVSQTSVTKLPGGYLVEFAAENHGNSTAAALLITGSLSENGQLIERRESTLDYLPQQAEREGGLIFQTNPQNYDLALVASGYAAP